MIGSRQAVARPDRPDAAVVSPFTYVTGVLSQVAVLTAMLYYFGWVRTQGSFAFFGLDPEIAGLSTTDFVLRSVRPTLRPVLLVTVLALAAVVAHESLVAPRLHADATRRRTLRPALVGATVAGSAALLWGLTALVSGWAPSGGADLVAPVCLAVGPLVVAYCRYCDEICRSGPAAGRFRRRPSAQSSLRGLLYVLSVGGAFWATGVYAAGSGWAAAEYLGANLQEQPDVVVFSAQRLALAGSGVTVQEITQPDSAFRFQYTGLRLLIKADERYILLPAAWQAGRDSAMVVDESDSTRFDIRSPLR